jgi:hypothetical protein
MRSFLARAFVVAGLAVAVPAFAQQPSGGATAAPSATGTTPSAAASATAPASSGSAEAPKAPSVPAGGYSYSDKPAPGARRQARAVRAAPAGPTATLPGFEQTADGGSRLFVHLTQQVPVEERRAQGSITYVLRGAHVRVRNNTNALVTVHFNTPVSRARLVPQGNDLLFVVDLRANVAPTFKMTDAPDKTAILTIDFPKGDYGTAAPRPAPAPSGKAETPAPPPPAPAPEPGPNP